MKDKFVRWYMGRITGRYCPCEWPVKVKFLIRLCARIDDAYERLEFHRFAAWYLGQQNITYTSSSNANTSVTWTRTK